MKARGQGRRGQKSKRQLKRLYKEDDAMDSEGRWASRNADKAWDLQADDDEDILLSSIWE